MKEIKKRRPGASNTRTAEGAATCSGVTVPKVKFSTSEKNRQIQVSDFLMRGVENATPRRHLRQLTGFSDRDLRRRIQEERQRGFPILSDNEHGYFLPADAEERARFVRSMRSRAKEIESVATAVEEAEID